MIAIIDYNAGNLKSVEKALHFLGEDCVITRNFHEIETADKVILPGVGAFGDAMYNLKKYGESGCRGTPCAGRTDSADSGSVGT